MKKLKILLISGIILFVGGIIAYTVRMLFCTDSDIMPIAHVTYGTEITLSRQNPQSENKRISPRRLVSIDYENRQACIEVYSKTSGWKKHLVAEGHYSPAGMLRKVETDRVIILVTWPGILKGDEAEQSYKLLNKFADYNDSIELKVKR
jgi:hypothetical protein